MSLVVSRGASLMTGPRLHWRIAHPDLLLGLARVTGLSAGPSGAALTAWLDEQLATSPDPAEAVRVAVRALLKRGGFKATGRNKPASEYLVEARRRGEFPRVLDCVDVMNVVSLVSGFPISLLDLERVAEVGGGRDLSVRLGAPDERYVFNTSGHVIDVENLLGVAFDDGPMIANPVKDSVPTKVAPGSRSVLAVVYASRAVVSEGEVFEVASRFATALGGGVVEVLTGP